MALLFAVSTFLLYDTVQPLSGMLVAKQCVFDTVRRLLLGVVVAGLNK